MQFHVQKKTCGGCAKSITNAVQSIDPNAKVTADPTSRKVEVTSDRPRAVFEAALKDAGYPPAPAA